MINLYPDSYLHDGYEEDLYTKDLIFNLSNDDIITFKVDDIAPQKLPEDFKDSPFYEFIKNDIKLEKSIVHGLVFTTISGNLNLYQSQVTSLKTDKTYTIISANGEWQPMRFVLWVGGVWEENT